MGQATIATGVIVLVATLVFACGGTTVPAPADGGSGTDGASADAGFGPIPCGDLTCAGTTPYCVVASKCGYSAADCVAAPSDGGACPKGYDDCGPLLGTPGCVSLYAYSCETAPRCQLTGPRTYGNCNC